MLVTSSPEQVLITLREPASAAAEAYRTLRTNILFSSLDKPIHTLLLTAAEPTPEKSLTAANLAVTMAQAEQRVLLVDCDLRQPALHTIFGISNEQGLTSSILDQDAPLAIQPTEVPGLSLLPSGPLPPRPADLLGSRRMEGLLARLKQAADIVIFDTPPVQNFTDALVLATRVDGVLLVVQANRSRRDRVREARQKLEKVKANLLGVVLSGART
ncbi:CpsD/CapB family tyrosine-protein kinase [Chloroflexus sp.]|uniref:CpsD/CapB family tyrosine-protein kinase n=1 Tax=Chloroflexus sp. TaxID=1904827 RepID=UPI00298EDA5A|nr:CpsD/CapB family tyrosine-protein kinase [Chloroflexus sp.]MCS6888941.1 CpsD/CapB family tyrosine-protein kinase [Chloroflexus sp.]MCX7858578.1 CpsD/CapB family tyrosine-protein kinase [Chloroflexus sp.]MDW8405469.1 CpsD/CapB family tyrosine-protein kinase [Chloroflexus sp.]